MQMDSNTTSATLVNVLGHSIKYYCIHCSSNIINLAGDVVAVHGDVPHLVGGSNRGVGKGGHCYQGIEAGGAENGDTLLCGRYYNFKICQPRIMSELIELLLLVKPE